MSQSEVVVVGAGIAGLTSAAILSKQGLSVTLIESHTQSGGCAGTFKRKNYIFDVGATRSEEHTSELQSPMYPRMPSSA